MQKELAQRISKLVAEIIYCHSSSDTIVFNVFWDSFLPSHVTIPSLSWFLKSLRFGTWKLFHSPPALCCTYDCYRSLWFLGMTLCPKLFQSNTQPPLNRGGWDASNKGSGCCKNIRLFPETPKICVCRQRINKTSTWVDFLVHLQAAPCQHEKGLPTCYV